MRTILAKSPVRFDEEQHRYFLGDRELYGVTSTLIKTAFPDTYRTPDGMSQDKWNDILSEAARKGKALHTTLELFENFDICDNADVERYIEVKEQQGLTHLESEYLVSDNERYASQIDHVYTNKDGGIVLVDVKRTSVLHEDNVTLQLSIYKRMFEAQNPDLKVSSVAVMWFHGDKVTYKTLTPWDDNALDELYLADRTGTPYVPPSHDDSVPVEFVDIQRQLATIEMQMKEAKRLQDDYRSRLLILMEERGIKKFQGELITLTYVAPTKRETLNAKALKEGHPDIYNMYKTESNVKSSLKINIRNG